MLPAKLFGMVAEHKDCFFCGEVLSFPLVVWSGCGPTGLVFLHGECAERLGVALIVDAAKIKQGLTGPGCGGAEGRVF